MIGDPVSFPRLAALVAKYEKITTKPSFFAVEVTEKAIMEGMLLANRRGLPVCTQGGEGVAGLKAALALGLLAPNERAVIDSTAHALKFMDFQNAYFQGGLEAEYGIKTQKELVNAPRSLEIPGPLPDGQTKLAPQDQELFVETTAKLIAQNLGLQAAS
jgi:threonine synthase